MMMTKRREFPKPVWRRVKKLTVRAPKAAGGLAGVGRPRAMKSCSPPCSTSCAPAFRGAICQRALVRGVRSTRASDVGAPWACSPACSRLSRRARKGNCAISIVRTSSCTRMGRIPAADRLHRPSAEPREGSTPSWRPSSSVVGAPSHSDWLRANATISSPSNPCSVACGSDVLSATEASSRQLSGATASPTHTRLHPAKEFAPLSGGVPSGLLSVPAQNRKLLLPHQTPSSHQHPFRKTCRHFSRLRPVRGRP